MKRTGFTVTILLLLGMLFLPWSGALAMTDGFYQLSKVSTAVWEGTDANRLKAASLDYDYTYGDESSVTYTLPWTFNFYGQPYYQITVDTNGNIWFAATGSAHSFTLANTNRGPVIAAWNDDLSSYYYGGVFIQHKTNPERVVIEWQTETYTEEGYYAPNSFETVIYQNGNIRVDYGLFAGVSVKDAGSGISKGDGSAPLSLTDNFGNAFALANQSFVFAAPGMVAAPTLTVQFSGTGSGTVTSDPTGIACNTNCSAPFNFWEPVTLTAAPAQYSLFMGWGTGSCSGTGSCVMVQDTDSTVTAIFDLDTGHQVLREGLMEQTYHPTIQGGYDAAVTGDLLKTWSLTFTENLLFNRPVEVTVKGGYDQNYTGQTGETIVNGTVTIMDGTVVMDGLSIR